MRAQLTGLVTLVSLAAASPLPAQQSTSLTLDEAIQIGLQRNRGLNSSLMKVEYAHAKSREADGLLLPSVTLTAAYTRLSDVPTSQISLPSLPQPITLSPSVRNNYALGVRVQQPLFTGFKLQRTAELAQYNARSAEKEFDRDRSALTFNIKSAYWNLSQTIDLQSVVNEDVESMVRHLNDVQSLQDQGMVAANEVLTVQVQLTEARLRQIDAGNNVQLARIGLNSLLGVPLDTEIQPATRSGWKPREYNDLRSLIQQAMERRPELQSMEFKVKASNAAVSIVQANWFPQVYLTGNYYSSRPNQRFFPAQDAFKDTWDVGVVLSFDVWNWGATAHQTEQARAQLSQAEDGLAELKDDVAVEVTKSYLRVLRAKERIAVAEKGVAEAEENYRVTNAKFKQGLSRVTDVLDAENALLRAKINHTQSLIDFELAEASVNRSIGE